LNNKNQYLTSCNYYEHHPWETPLSTYSDGWGNSIN